MKLPVVTLRLKHLATLSKSRVLKYPNIYPDPVGVTGAMTKIKVACDTVRLTWIPVVCMGCSYRTLFGHEEKRTKSDLSISIIGQTCRIVDLYNLDPHLDSSPNSSPFYRINCMQSI